MSNQEALSAIEDIKAGFGEYANSINLRQQTQSLTPADAGYSSSNPALNKGTITDSAVIKAFVDDTPVEEQQHHNIAGKRVKTFTFYTELSFNKVDSKIMYKSDEYEIKYIGETIIQDTVILYEVIGAN